MEPGNIIEFIDKQKIVSAVVTEIKNQRLRALAENNREVNLSMNRLSHKCKDRLQIGLGREKLTARLKEIAQHRKALAETIDIETLWDVLHPEQEWVDLPTMTGLCFSEAATADHEAAVVRAFFGDRMYFKFDHDRFLPYTPDKVEHIKKQAAEAERRQRLVKAGSDWIKRIGALAGKPGPEYRVDGAEYIDILKAYYLFEKESRSFDTAKAMLAQAGMDSDIKIFKLLVKLGVWQEDENIELLRQETPVAFSDRVLKQAEKLAGTVSEVSAGREDIRSLPLITIDGPSTLDFDDALSLEALPGECFRVGVHIVDVGSTVRKTDPLDTTSRERASSIYMPDLRIPMLPPLLSENSCSLRQDESRPAVSIFATLDRFAALQEFEIVPTMVKVHRQLTYAEADEQVETDFSLKALYHLARHFRRNRLENGAIQLILPEINIYLKDSGDIEVVRTDRESPARMLVAEMMIMANWLMARYLGSHSIPAIFRSQPAPKNRIIKDADSGFFEHCMQRKHLSRGIISLAPEHHSGLGLDAYVTATSPIRKYSDLVTQRQIRAQLGLESFYSAEEIQEIIHTLEQPLQHVSRLQFQRHRYWLLRYLEKRIGSREEAVVLEKRRDSYQVMLPAYMLECKIPQSGGGNLRPGDFIRVTLQHVNARNDLISLYLT